MKKELLVVDDEVQILSMYSLAFKRAGYTVQTAETAEDALEIQNNHPYWVLFLDLNLPGMSGVELCRQIRKSWPMSICYAVTGYVSLFELSHCRDAGFEDYFIKPVPIADLLEAADQGFKKLARWKAR